MFRIGIIEDDPAVRDELARLLDSNGYTPVLLEQFDDPTSWILHTAPDLVLLDLGLPTVDGHWLCREIHEKAPIPIIVVTSRDSDMDELMAMNFGADDFITKPYNTYILLAHIAAVLSRTYGERDSHILSAAGLTLNIGRNEISFQGKTARITNNEQRLLSLLIRHQGEIVSRQHLQMELWDSDQFIDDNTLSVNISYLRSSLKSIGADGLISTVRGRGYMLEDTK